MKYQIIYLGNYNVNAVYYIGKDKAGKAMYRSYSTKRAISSPSARALFAALVTL